MVFATSYERLAPQMVEDQAVLVRGLVLPEESAPAKISVQDIVALENARVDLPSVISIRVWLGRNGSRRSRRRSKSSSAASPATRRCACAWNRRAISPCSWTCRRRCAPTRNSAPRSKRSAAPRALNAWRDKARRTGAPSAFLGPSAFFRNRPARLLQARNLMQMSQVFRQPKPPVFGLGRSPASVAFLKWLDRSLTVAARYEGLSRSRDREGAVEELRNRPARLAPPPLPGRSPAPAARCAPN